MKTIRKKLNSKKLAKEIDSFGYEIEANMIAHGLMELYLNRFDDFHLIIGQEVVNCFTNHFGYCPFSNIPTFQVFCYQLAQCINHTNLFYQYYLQLKGNGIFETICLTKKKKEATDPETLIQYIENIYCNGLNP